MFTDAKKQHMIFKSVRVLKVYSSFLRCLHLRGGIGDEIRTPDPAGPHQASVAVPADPEAHVRRR